MLGIVLRGIVVRRVRFVLTSVAIVVAIALVSGTLVLAQSVRHSYDRLLSQVTTGTDVYVRGPETDIKQGLSDFAPVPQPLLDSLQSVRGVAMVQGQVVRRGQLVSLDGRFLNPGRTMYASSWPASEKLSPFRMVLGRPPRAPGEAVLDRATALADALRVGAVVRVSMDFASPRPAQIVGIAAPRDGADLSGASAVFLQAGWAQQILGLADQWDLLELAAAPGVSADELRGRVAARLPDDGTSAITSRQYAEGQVRNLSRRSDSISTILVALSGLALVVASAVILNTFTIVVAQRARELALLRTLGMTRRQVYISVTGEAALVGLVTSSLGAALGVPISYALQLLVRVVGEDVPSSELDVEPLTLGLIIALGTLLTAVISTLPAARAARASPMVALRGDKAASQGRVAKRLPAASATLFGLGALIAMVGLVGPPEDRLVLVSTGGSAAALGLFAGLPAAAVPALRCLGALASWTGPPGAVAQMQLLRNPRRAVIPAAALTLGLGLITGVSVAATSAGTSISHLVSRADRADFVIVSDSAPGVDPEVVDKVREAPAVAVVSKMGADSFTVDGRTDVVTALDTETLGSVLALVVVSGELSQLGDGTVVVTRSVATERGYRVGDRVSARFGEPVVSALRIAAIVEDNGVTGNWVVSWNTYSSGYHVATIRAAFVKRRSGVTQEELKRQVDVGVAGFPGIAVKDAMAYSQSQAQAIQGPVALVDALVALSILIALIGVMNTLGLSVVERSSELRLLRIVGMTRGQLSSSVRWEAILIALLGVVSGVATGLVLGLALVGSLRTQGITEVVVPTGKLLVAMALVVVGALLASALPAYRAGALARSSGD